MELKEYLKIIKSEKRTIAGFAILTALSAFVFSVYAPASYEASVSLFITKDGTQQTDQFKYDGYYALDAGEIITDNVGQMLKSPEIVAAIYRRSGIDPEFKRLKNYKKKFSASAMSNQYVEVSFNVSNRGDAEKIAEAITETVGEKLSEEKAASGEEVSYAIEGSNPVIVEKKPDAAANGLAGLVSGLLLGVFAAFLKKYLS